MNPAAAPLERGRTALVVVDIQEKLLPADEPFIAALQRIPTAG